MTATIHQLHPNQEEIPEDPIGFSETPWNLDPSKIQERFNLWIATYIEQTKNISKEVLARLETSARFISENKILFSYGGYVREGGNINELIENAIAGTIQPWSGNYVALHLQADFNGAEITNFAWIEDMPTT